MPVELKAVANLDYTNNMADKDKLGHDKVLHALACFGISLYSTEAAIAAALAKEYGDKGSPFNHWCWWDLAWDMLGVTVGTTIRILISGRWNWF